MNNKEPGYVYILTNPSFREDWVCTAFLTPCVLINGKFHVFWLNSEESDAYRKYAEGPKTKNMFMGKKMPVILVLPTEDIP